VTNPFSENNDESCSWKPSSPSSPDRRYSGTNSDEQEIANLSREEVTGGTIWRWDARSPRHYKCEAL
jgi:hypothetical protein